MPRFEVRSSLALFVCQCCHYGTGLILGVCNSKGEQASLVLRVELDGGGGHDEASRSLPLYEPRFDALRGLLHGLVADTPLREQRAHEVGGELPAHTCCLVDDQEAMLYGLLRVGESAFAHGREGIVGALWDEGEHPLHHMALAAGRRTFERDTDRPS